MAGIHLDGIRQLRQPSQRVEEPFCTFTGLDRKVGPGGVADEERVTGEHEPLVHDERTVLGTVARRMYDTDRHGADLQLLPVLQRVERKLGLGDRVHRDGQALLQREAAVAGNVVGVGMRLQHPDDPNAGLGRGLEIRLDRIGGVDHESLPTAGIADQIRGAAEIVVDELAKEHEPEATSGPR